MRVFFEFASDLWPPSGHNVFQKLCHITPVEFLPLIKIELKITQQLIFIVTV